MDNMFNLIKSEYISFQDHLKESGKGLVYRTDKGIYGTTDLDNIFKFFKQINLQNYKSFLDLGCGDGRVVLVASLFTKATGIEFDQELCDIANKIKKDLDLNCNIICDDFLKHNLNEFDIIFMNPDHEFDELNEKLVKEFKGTLFIYNEIFAPIGMKKGKKFWPGQIPIVSYSKI